MPRLTFLSADRPLNKSYVLNPDGTYDSTPYPLVTAVTTHTEEVADISEFYDQLIDHSNAQHCLLKGSTIRPLVRESRAGLTAPEATWYSCMDFDGIDPQGRTIDDILEEVGVGDVDYIIQYSASYGIKDGLSCHIFQMLTDPVAPEYLKNFLRWKNLTTPYLREQLCLTATGMALHWPLDISVADNSRLIYLAAPKVVNGTDPVPERTKLVRRGQRKLTLPEVPQGLDGQVVDLIRQLRSAAGYPEHKLVTKYNRQAQADVLANPERVSITGVKTDGDFTRVNVNASTSWGYYHLTAFPEVLMNFRGEPNYLLREIAPDYYKDAKNAAKSLKLDSHRPTAADKEPQRWVINRKDEGRYYKVTYLPNKGITLDPAPSLKHLEDWCILNKVPVPDIIEDWEVIFDPTSTNVIEPAIRRINSYKPTVYKVNSQRNGSAIPLEYRNLINHVCGNDDEATDYFINWLAYIWQTGKRPKTAWVFGGTYGTGKGRLLLVLKHLFGSHCIAVGPEALEDKFNEHLEPAQIVWLDELTTDSWDTNKMTPKLRALIDGESGLRQMRRGWRGDVNLYFGLIIASNEHNVVEIRAEDRRFNVAPRQETPLLKAPWLYDDFTLLDDELGFFYQPENLQAFADGLTSYQVDVASVRRPLKNDAKDAVMRVTQSLPEDIVQALDSGNVNFFLEYMPQDQLVPSVESSEYINVVEKMVRGGKVPLSVKEITRIFEFVAGWRQPPGKFTKACARFGLDLRGKTAREGTKVYSGTYFVFNPTEDDKAMYAQRVEKKGPHLVREAGAAAR